MPESNVEQYNTLAWNQPQGSAQEYYPLDNNGGAWGTPGVPTLRPVTEPSTNMTDLSSNKGLQIKTILQLLFFFKKKNSQIKVLLQEKTM